MFSASKQQSGLSWWLLCIFFVLAVLLFVILRWQPEPWLRTQIDRLILPHARQHGIMLQYDGLHTKGLTIYLDHLSIRTAELPVPVKIDSLIFSSAWASLLTGRPGVQVLAKSHGQHGAALLTWHDGLIAVHDLDADLDVAQLQPLWQRQLSLPIHVGGRMILSGDMLFNAASGVPVGGDIKAVWKSAITDVTGLDKPLGDYRLVLKVGEEKVEKKKSGKKKAKSWQWSLTGGSVLKLSGRGAIDTSGVLPRQWGINGRIRLDPLKNGNAIAAMLGGRAMEFKLSGNVLNPRLQAIAIGH